MKLQRNCVHWHVLLYVLIGSICYMMSCQVPQKEQVKISNRIVRVALQHKVPSFKLHTYSDFHMKVKGEGDDWVLVTSGEHEFSLDKGRLCINGKAIKGQSFLLKHPNFDKAWRVGDRVYRGKMHVHQISDTEISLIHHVDLETYTASVVAKEAGTFFVPEALRCQAVVARTFVWHRIRKTPRSRSLFDVYDDQRDQVFKGVTDVANRHILATNATRHQVIMWQGDILETFYHSTCGGSTVNALEMKFVHKAKAPLMPQPCNWCQHSRLYRWKHQMKVNDLVAKFKQLKGKRVTRFESIIRPGGHVKEIRAHTDKGYVTISSKDFRRQLGFGDMRSYKFSCKIKGDMLLIDGQGFGHGVGMCQFGTDGMAREGRNYQQILSYYYPGSQLKEIR